MMQRRSSGKNYTSHAKAMVVNEGESSPSKQIQPFEPRSDSVHRPSINASKAFLTKRGHTSGGPAYNLDGISKRF